jgi:hypothetical protein
VGIAGAWLDDYTVFRILVSTRELGATAFSFDLR